MSKQLKHRAPTGMALYGRAFSSSRHGTPKQFAKKCADHGLKWYAIGGPWHEDRRGKNCDRWINSPAKIKRYAEALSNAGVKPHVWGYPWHSRIEKFVEDLDKCMSGAIVGRLLDPELGLKKHPEAARELLRLLRNSSKHPYSTIGFTSYGLPHGHKTFPFAEFAEPGGFDFFAEADYGSPQLYDTPLAQILRGMSDYSKLGFDIVIPSFGLYKWVRKDPDLPLSRRNRKAVPMSRFELDQHLLRFLDSEIPVQAMIGWAENFATAGLWRTLAEWSERLERGALVLPGGGS